MSDADDVTTWELVYPLEWLSSLPPIVLRLAEDHDPYENYDFGSHWRERRV
jgi:hypothetical protein